MQDDLTPALVAAFHALPAQVSPLQALRGAPRLVFAGLSKEEWIESQEQYNWGLAEALDCPRLGPPSGGISIPYSDRGPHRGGIVKHRKAGIGKIGPSNRVTAADIAIHGRTVLTG